MPCSQTVIPQVQITEMFANALFPETSPLPLQYIKQDQLVYLPTYLTSMHLPSPQSHNTVSGTAG